MTRLLPARYLLPAAGLALLYLVWTFVARYSAGRRMEHAAEAQRVARDRASGHVPGIGTGDSVRILQFYISPAEVPPGGKALLCYGVVNARAARIEPEPGPVTPSLSRCLEITPKKDTLYTLTAAQANGLQVSASSEIRVRFPQRR